MYEDEDVNHRIANFIGIAIVIGAVLFFAPRFLRSRASGTYNQCQSNLKNISFALQKYAGDNDDNYPLTLSALTPKYLKTIPTCAKARRDTYSLYYRTSRERKRFTLFCQGINHPGAGIREKNWPQYNSTEGLKARP